MKKPFFILSSFLLLTSAVPYNTLAEDVPKEEVIVSFKNDIDLKAISNVNGVILDELSHLDMVKALIPVNLIDDLQANPNVSFIEENKVLKIDSPLPSPSSDVASLLASQSTQWGVERIKSDEFWNKGYTGKGIQVLVLDTGADPAHEDLVVTEGYTATVENNAYYVGPGFSDAKGHGTHVAGIIAAKDNAVGTKGVAPDVDLYVVRLTNSQNDTYLYGILESMDGAIQKGIDVVNMSIGTTTHSPSIQSALQKAYDAGILLVGSAGNDGAGGAVVYPAAYSTVIAVGSTDSANKRSTFSTTGTQVEVSAPGSSIYSTYPKSLNASGYTSMSGTSMAAPHVTGLLALYKQAFPTLTNVQLRQKLIENTLDLGAAGKDVEYGYGLVQAPTLSIPQEDYKFPLHIFEFVRLYNYPDPTAYSGYALNAQTVNALKRGTGIYNNWYMIETSIGNKWIQTDRASAEVSSKTQKYITFLDTVKAYGKSVVYSFDPQTVLSSEQVSDWYRIDTRVGSLWIHKTNVREGAPEKTSTKIRLLETAPLYYSASTLKPSPYQLNPQTVHAFEQLGEWYRIYTGAGPLWVNGNNHLPEGSVEKLGKTLQIATQTSSKTLPIPSAPNGPTLAPGKYGVFEKWLNWYHIYTPQGSAWVSLADPALQDDLSYPNSLFLTETETAYFSPTDTEGSGYRFNPQTVTTLKKWNDWYQIQTGVGPLWIKPKNALTGQAESVAIKLMLSSKISLYTSPSSSSVSSYQLAPQTVQAFEKWGNWYRIHTGIGPMWIKSSGYVTEGTSSPYHNWLAITQYSSLYYEPNTTSESIYRIAPQNVYATEVWNSWYKIQTSVGPMWVKK